MEKQVISSELQVSATDFSAQLAASKLCGHLEANDVRAFMHELSFIIKASGGYTIAARAAGLNRTALYKIVSPDGNPEFKSLVSLLRALGLRLAVAAGEGKDEREAGRQPRGEVNGIAVSEGHQ